MIEFSSASELPFTIVAVNLLQILQLNISRLPANLAKTLAAARHSRRKPPKPEALSSDRLLARVPKPVPSIARISVIATFRRLQLRSMPSRRSPIACSRATARNCSAANPTGLRDPISIPCGNLLRRQISQAISNHRPALSDIVISQHEVGVVFALQEGALQSHLSDAWASVLLYCKIVTAQQKQPSSVDPVRGQELLHPSTPSKGVCSGSTTLLSISPRLIKR